MKSTKSSQAANAKGFTLTDLVVVIAVICMLSIVCLTAMAGAKSQFKIATCADNIRQLVGASQIYASENQDVLPGLNSIGDWPWDAPDPATQVMLNTGLQKKNFYCPSTQPRFTDWQNFLWPNNNLWDFGGASGIPNSFHIVGYAFAYWGSSSKLYSTNQNKTMQPELFTVNGIPVVTPNSRRVLVADVILSTLSALPGYLHPENDYTYIRGGYQIAHLSAHLNGAVPAGHNLGFKDGHVEWRPLDDTVVPRNPNGPYFWW